LVFDGRVGPQTWGALRPVALPPRPTTPAPPTPAMLQRGSSGPEVLRLQKALLAAGFSPSGLDGRFGPKTEAALRAFQRARGLTVDGRAGPQTWAALDFPPPAAPAPAPGRTARLDGMLAWAKSMLGTPYAAVNPFRFGDVPWDGKAHASVNGSGTIFRFPKGTRVFDCSGFIVAAYRRLGVDLAGRGLASSWAFHADTAFLQPLRREQLAPGDLIVYHPRNGVGHVVLYLGNGMAIESKGGRGVIVSDVDWNRARSFRRVPLP
ncbi:MAG: peptidoglycan-binding protein, partial [Myxococcales bacterium]